MAGRQTVVITGGTKGIGAGIARSFAAGGWSVVVGARSNNDSVGELGEAGRFVKLDVRNEADHVAAARLAVEWTGRLDCWVNAAGYSAWRSIADIDAAFWEDILATNLTGALWGCKAAAAVLESGGSIVNVSSLAGKRGSAQNSAYCATKFAMNGLTQALAKELGPRGIRVNAVCPVYVVTPGLMEALDDARSPKGTVPLERFLTDFAEGQAALKRLPTAAEVGASCVYLASPAASAITGQCINVDCGVMPQ